MLNEVLIETSIRTARLLRCGLYTISFENPFLYKEIIGKNINVICRISRYNPHVDLTKLVVKNPRITSINMSNFSYEKDEITLKNSLAFTRNLIKIALNEHIQLFIKFCQEKYGNDNKISEKIGIHLTQSIDTSLLDVRNRLYLMEKCHNVPEYISLYLYRLYSRIRETDKVLAKDLMKYTERTTDNNISMKAVIQKGFELRGNNINVDSISAGKNLIVFRDVWIGLLGRPIFGNNVVIYHGSTVGGNFIVGENTDIANNTDVSIGTRSNVIVMNIGGNELVGIIQIPQLFNGCSEMKNDDF